MDAVRHAIVSHAIEEGSKGWTPNRRSGLYAVKCGWRGPWCGLKWQL